MAFLRLLFVFILPPVAIYLQFGFGKHFVINLLLTALGFLPGVLHAALMMSATYPGWARRDRFDTAKRSDHAVTRRREQQTT